MEKAGRGKLISKLKISLQHFLPFFFFFMVHFAVCSIKLAFAPYKSQISDFSGCPGVVIGGAEFGNGEEMAPGQLFF